MNVFGAPILRAKNIYRSCAAVCPGCAPDDFYSEMNERSPIPSIFFAPPKPKNIYRERGVRVVLAENDEPRKNWVGDFD